MIDRQWCLLCR